MILNPKKHKLSETQCFIPLARNVKYWDLQSKLVFLEDGLYLNLDRGFLDDLKYASLRMEDIAYDGFETEQERFIADISYEIGRILNQYHKLNLSESFWKKVLYIWLKGYTRYSYEKYSRLEAVFRLYRDEKKVIQFLRDDAYAGIMKDWEDIQLTTRDVQKGEAYSLHIYSKILLRNSQWKCEKKEVFIPPKKNYWPVCPEGQPVSIILRGKFFALYRALRHPMKVIKRLLRYVYSRRDKAYVRGIIMDGIPGIDDIIIRSQGKIRYVPMAYLSRLPVQKKDIDRKFRAVAKKTLYESMKKRSWAINDGYEQFVLSSIFEEMPLSYIEDFKEIKEYYGKRLKQYSNLQWIMTLIGDWFTPVSFALLEQQDVHGVKLIEMQHGGAWGTQVAGTLDYTGKLADVFYGWGTWADAWQSFGSLNLKNAPSVRLSIYDMIHVPGKKEGILYVGEFLALNITFDTILPNYCSRKYIDDQIEFLSRLNKKIRENLIVRNYPEDYGCNINKKIKKIFPNINVSSSADNETAESFSVILSRVELAIFDHVNTPWLEALYIGVPFILILPKESKRILFVGKEQKYIKMMEKAGLVHYNIAECVAYLNSISGMIDLWWNEPERQSVAVEVRNRYMYKVKDIKKWWRKEVLSYLE